MRKDKKEKRAIEQDKIIEMKNSYKMKFDSFIPTQVPYTEDDNKKFVYHM